jgi:MFS family permease
MNPISAAYTQPDRDAGLVHGLTLACVPAMVVATVCTMLPIQPAMIRSFPNLANAGDLVSLAVVLPTLTVALVSPVAGVIGDWVGRRRLLILSTAVFAVSAVAPVWLDSITLILIARALAGLAIGTMVTSAVALTGDYYSGAALQWWLAAQGAVASITAVLVSFASGAIAEINWHDCFLLLLVGVPLFAAVALVPAPNVDRSQRSGAVRTPKQDDHAPWMSWAGIFGVTISGTLIIYPPTFELGYLLQEKSLGSSFVTGVATAVAGAGAVGGALSLRALSRLSAPARAALAISFAALGTPLVAEASSLPPLMVGAVLVGVCQGMLAPVLSVWLLERTPEYIRGRAVGALQTATFVAIFAAPLLAHRLAVADHSTAASLRLCALADVILVAALASSLIKHRVAARAATPET